MLENLIQLVKENAGDAIINNNAIPNDQNNAAVSETANSIVSALKNHASNGGIGDLMSLLKGGNAQTMLSNPAVQNVMKSVASNLGSKFNLSNEQSQHIVSTLIPNVMEKLVSKTNDPNDSSFDVQGMMKNFGGNLGGLGSMLGGLSSLFGK